MFENPLHEIREILALQREALDLERESLRLLHRILYHLNPATPTHLTFKEITMNPTQAGQTQVFTGTLEPAGAKFPADSVFAVVSNDSAVSPSVDTTGLIVSVTYPDGWTENPTTPLAFAYTATSASTGMSLSATITPSAPPAPVPTGITFTQTT